MRRLVLVIASFAVVPLTGCLDDSFLVNGNGMRNKPVDMTSAKEADVAVAARVDQIGRQLVSQNPFLGVEPTFHTLGRSEPELFHPDDHGIFITEGLVKRCSNDDELAAVLAMELAQLSSEARTKSKMRLIEPMRTNLDNSAMNPGGFSSDLNQLGTQAIFDRPAPKTDKNRMAASEPKQIAEDILKGAGYDVKLVTRVQPLIQEAARSTNVADSMSQKAKAPRWSY